ncbi:MAG: phospholipase D-like domain-containing protein [Candidatus Syntropharchaeales archaeon]
MNDGYISKNTDLQKRLKETSNYKLIKRLEYLENYINQNIQQKKLDTDFVVTFEGVGINDMLLFNTFNTIKQCLDKMVLKADIEIIIVSPWITKGGWNSVKPSLLNFINKGGKIKVFMKGDKEDFLRGLSDRDVVNQIRSLGGEVRFIPKLHAKLCVIDNREALVTSANFTSGGFNFNYETGIWTCNPYIVEEIRDFIDKLDKSNFLNKSILR